MSKSIKSRAKSEYEARCNAEDSAVAYLATFPPEVAFATALMAESMLAAEWAAEQTKMMERGDNRKVYQIGEDDFQRMREARKFISPGGRVHIEALHCILRLIREFEPDKKWKTASAIAFRAAARVIFPDGFFPEAGAASTSTGNLL
jgi:hypothetical protein